MLQNLLQTRTQIEAELLISRLRAAGLHPADLRVWPHVTLAGGDLFYSVEVPTEEVEEANRVVQALRGEDGTSANGRSKWAALRIGVFLVLVAIALGMLLP